MTELCKDNFDYICRLCSSSLTATKHEICGKLGLSSVIEECLQIKVQKSDSLPQNLCDNCLLLLQNFSTFRTTCYDTQTKLIACVKLNGDTDDLKVDLKTNSEVKSEQADATEQESAGEPQSTISSDTDEVELKENGLEKLPELSDPGSEDYVLMKEETFSLDANREIRNVPGMFSDNLVEFNNNSTNNNNNVNNSSSSDKDKDLIDGQRLRKDIVAPMWDVFEKIWPRSEGTNGDKTTIRVIHRRYVVSKLAFPCSLCGECFKFDQGYERGGTPEIRPYDCTTCGKVFPRRSSWKRHQATHEDVKPFQCRVCGKGFNRKEHLSRHLLLHGATKPSYSCEKCGKFFTRSEHLNRHLLNSPMCWDNSNENFVPVNRPYSCQHCGQSFIRKEHLTRHIKRAHDIDPTEGEAEPRPFTCLTCNKAFTRREHLKRHQLIHVKEMSMETQQAEEVQCLPQFDAVPNMSEDNPTPSPPNSPEERKPEEQRKKLTVVTCQLCHKGFSRRSHLSRHLRQVHKVCPEGSEEVHRCNECGKDFGRRYHLERHAKTHMNTTYECVTCGEKFTESEALDKHMTVHGNTVLENFLWM